MRNSVNVCVNILRQIRHDRRTIGLVVFVPIIIMTLFGYTFAGEPSDIRVVVVNMDSGSVHTPHGDMHLDLGASVVDNLDRDVLSIDTSDDLDWARQQVRDGRAWAVIYIPENFTSEMASAASGNTSASPSITLYLDNSNVQIGGAVVKAVMGALEDTLRDMGPGMAFTDLVKKDYIYGEDASFMDFFAPGVMGMVGTIITILLTIVSLVRERKSGTLERIYASPVRPHEVALGYTMAFALISLLQSAEIIAVALLVFDLHIVGSALLVLFIVFLYAVCMQGLGTFLSTLAKNEFQAVQFVPMVMVPSLILAGVFWPLESMPSLMRPVAYFIPLTYELDALRSVMIRGWGAAQIAPDLAVLMAFGAVMFLLSAWVMKRRYSA